MFFVFFLILNYELVLNFITLFLCSYGNDRNFLLYSVNVIELHGVSCGGLGGIGDKMVWALEWQGEQSFSRCLFSVSGSVFFPSIL